MDNMFVFDKLGICGCGDDEGQVNFIKHYLNLIRHYKYMNPKVIELIRDNPEFDRTIFIFLGVYGIAQPPPYPLWGIIPRLLAYILH